MPRRLPRSPIRKSCPIDQNTARFYNRVAFDMDYGGMANTDAEGDRLGGLLGNKQIMMMGNHGVLVCASTVAEAFDLTYYLERACRNLVLAYQTGQKLMSCPRRWPRRPPRNGKPTATSSTPISPK